MQRIDLTGKRFGRLVVTDYSHSHIQPSGQKRAVWNVLCDCGKKKKTQYVNLWAGNAKSCGCIKREGNRKLPLGVASFNSKYKAYGMGAKVRHLEFCLTPEQFKEMALRPCHYCGAEKSNSHKAKKNSNGAFEANGIDRIDSLKGYVLENCVPCCGRCNWMKAELSYSEFITHIQRIVSYAPKTL